VLNASFFADVVVFDFFVADFFVPAAAALLFGVFFDRAMADISDGNGINSTTQFFDGNKLEV
jgi:hypothetical protein